MKMKRQSLKKHVDLLLLSNSTNSHSVRVEDFNRFMTNKTKHCKKHFCLPCFSISKVLGYRAKNCLASNHTKSVLLPEETEYVNFQNFKRLAKASVIIYGDFECILIPSTDNINFVPNTKEYQDHIICSYGNKLICVDDQY